ncbi:MAG: 50S ribosomal protein L10 [Candidatus Dadabacteria bacterium]|nr:50S ribosomal protein L10 [Candidatus Dadabacteria bacterium]NIS07790.1 50S ribosomal protein L10 [Candidatus Dadabacteria bacterium]NIY21412.1 50S ribosomal protein L10 [Candidatus Dadabacteria bacterium]
MLSKQEKIELAKEYGDKFKSASSVFVLDYKGLSVKEMQELRRSVKKANAQFSVVKNSVLKYGASGSEVEKIADMFVGPTAVAISEEDPVSVAKAFVESVKTLPQVKLKGGLVDGSVVNESEITSLSKLPSREAMIGQFIGMLNNPLIGFLATVKNMQSKLVYALNEVKNQKES